MKNYYSVLDIHPDAGIEEIRDSYRRLVQHHLSDSTKFDELQEAYEVLTNPERRAKHDMDLLNTAADTTTIDRTMQFDRSLPNNEQFNCPFAGAAVCPSNTGLRSKSDTFCTECGVQFSSIVNRSFESEHIEPLGACFEEETGRRQFLLNDVNTVGREQADVILADKTISRLHAQFHQSSDDVVTVEDLDSTNGTYVNGERLVPHALRVLSDGDTLRFGSVRGSFRSKPKETTGLEIGLDAVPVDRAKQLWPDDPSTSLEHDGDSMKIIIRSVSGVDFSLDPPGPVSVGRRPDNTIPIAHDPFVSGRHMQFIYEEPNWIAVDLGSTNGTYVNENRMPPHEHIDLSEGDTVSIGGETFTVIVQHGEEENLRDTDSSIIALDGGQSDLEIAPESIDALGS